MRSLLILFLSSGCGTDTTITRKVYINEQCTTEDTDAGVIIKCPDGTDALVKHGRDGSDGEDGAQGAQGPAGVQGEQGEAGAEGVMGPIGQRGETGSTGDDGKDGSAGEDFIPPEEVVLEGYYELPNGGYIELIENGDEEIIVYGTQRMYSVNFDLGLALHPNLPAGPHNLNNGKIAGEYNSNYSSSTNDLEVDGTTTNITGVRKTRYILTLDSEGRLVIQLITYASGGLSIAATRTITSL